MKKHFRIILLFIVLIFLSTYTPNTLNKTQKKDNNFFKISKIEILNNNLIKQNEIKKNLSQILGRNIFLINKEDIEKPLEFFNFLEKIEVKKKYPNTIVITVYETKPIAILFQKKEKVLIDSSSNLISLTNDININNLPNVFGDGAEIVFLDFLKLLKKNNFPTQKIKNYYYFQIGRWDVELNNNKLLKFPKEKIDSAVLQSINLLDRENFKNYNTIDLRIYGKIIVE